MVQLWLYQSMCLFSPQRASLWIHTSDGSSCFWPWDNCSVPSQSRKCPDSSLCSWKSLVPALRGTTMSLTPDLFWQCYVCSLMTVTSEVPDFQDCFQSTCFLQAGTMILLRPCRNRSEVWLSRFNWIMTEVENRAVIFLLYLQACMLRLVDICIQKLMSMQGSHTTWF